MDEQALTRADIADAVYRQVGFSGKESKQFVQQIIQEISESLARGEGVKVYSFGSFVTREKPQRLGRNPRTGAEVMIAPRRVISFRASQILKKRMNGQAQR